MPFLFFCCSTASPNRCSLCNQPWPLLLHWAAQTITVLFASSNHCCFVGQPNPLLSCRPALTIAVLSASSNRFFASFAAVWAVALLLGGLVLALACPSTACKKHLPFAYFLGSCLAASCFHLCYILSTWSSSRAWPIGTCCQKRLPRSTSSCRLPPVAAGVCQCPLASCLLAPVARRGTPGVFWASQAAPIGRCSCLQCLVLKTAHGICGPASCRAGLPWGSSPTAILYCQSRTSWAWLSCCSTLPYWAQIFGRRLWVCALLSLLYWPFCKPLGHQVPCPPGFCLPSPQLLGVAPLVQKTGYTRRWRVGYYCTSSWLAVATGPSCLVGGWYMPSDKLLLSDFVAQSGR